MLKIFLAYASEDKAAVTRLYHQLKERGYEPWLDKEKLLPGQTWRTEICKAIKASDVFIACLSKLSVAKQGYVQKEFRMALNTYAEKPSGSIYLIPVRLDACEIPELRQEEYGVNLRDIQWMDFFSADGFERLMRSIESGFPGRHRPQTAGPFAEQLGGRSSRSIFISYRRSDSQGHTGRIYDRLVTEFGREHVFKDVDSIPLGVDFAEHLAQEVSKCQVVLVVIGQSWTTVSEPDGTRRLDNPDDFVRIEIESALSRGIPVIPVLLQGVRMPKRSELPESLHPLVRRNGTEVGYDPDFHLHMNRLIKGLQELLQGLAITPEPIAEVLTEEVATVPDKSSSTSSAQSLSTFSYEVVTVDQKGREVTREQQSAQYVQEDLGNDVSLDMVLIPGGSFLRQCCKN